MTALRAQRRGVAWVEAVVVLLFVVLIVRSLFGEAA